MIALFSARSENTFHGYVYFLVYKSNLITAASAWSLIVPVSKHRMLPITRAFTACGQHSHPVTGRASKRPDTGRTNRYLLALFKQIQYIFLYKKQTEIFNLLFCCCDSTSRLWIRWFSMVPHCMQERSHSLAHSQAGLGTIDLQHA